MSSPRSQRTVVPMAASTFDLCAATVSNSFFQCLLIQNDKFFGDGIFATLLKSLTQTHNRAAFFDPANLAYGS